MKQQSVIVSDFRVWLLDSGIARSENTRYTYAMRVLAAERWLIENHEVSVVWANVEQLQAWLSSLPPTAESRNIARSAIVAFFRYLAARNYVSRDLPRRIKEEIPHIAPAESIPKALRPAQAKAVLQRAREIGGLTEMTVLIYTLAGLRRNEARTLTWQNVVMDGTEGAFRVDGKGGKQRVVPIHDMLIPRLRRWRLESGSAHYVLPSPRRLDRPASMKWIADCIHGIGQEVGIPELHPHMLRHTFATMLLDSGADVPTVSQILGHSNMSTTSIYLRVWPEKAQEAVRRLLATEPQPRIVRLEEAVNVDP